MLYDPKWKVTITPSIKRNDLTELETHLLLRVREGLETGTISPSQFNMEKIARNAACGTVGCLAGWMAVTNMKDLGFTQKEIRSEVSSEASTWDRNPYFLHVDEPKFASLFFPPVHAITDDGGWTSLTVDQGIIALDRFFAGFAEPWDFASRGKIAPQYRITEDAV